MCLLDRTESINYLKAAAIDWLKRAAAFSLTFWHRSFRRMKSSTVIAFPKACVARVLELCAP